MSKAHRDGFNTLAPEWSVRILDNLQFRELLILYTSSREQVNQFHVTLQGVVKSDRLPSLSDFETYFQQARIGCVSMIDEEGLFWVEGRKAFL